MKLCRPKLLHLTATYKIQPHSSKLYIYLNVGQVRFRMTLEGSEGKEEQKDI